jgi:hypothetical protein
MMGYGPHWGMMSYGPKWGIMSGLGGPTWAAPFSMITNDHMAVAARGGYGRCGLAFAFVSNRQATTSDSPHIWSDLLN